MIFPAGTWWFVDAKIESTDLLPAEETFSSILEGEGKEEQAVEQHEVVARDGV